jgi:hypothetical protein
MYGLGGVPFSAIETWKESERTGDTVGKVVKEILRKNGNVVEDV